MTVTANDIKRLRSMINEPTSVTYTDADLTTLIENAAIPDNTGKFPSETDWIPTYNIYKVAADIWLEKAAKVADEFDFDADGGSFQRSQKQKMAMKQASFFESRSNALSLQMKRYPITHAGVFGWGDLPYKDEIEDYEAGLT